MCDINAGDTADGTSATVRQDDMAIMAMNSLGTTCMALFESPQPLVQGAEVRVIRCESSFEVAADARSLNPSKSAQQAFRISEHSTVNIERRAAVDKTFPRHSNVFAFRSRSSFPLFAAFC